MNRIIERFEWLSAENRKGFIPFVTAGDPDIASSKRIILKLAELGADVIELGVPFSDPMADGPTIQASSQRALCGGVNLPKILELVGEVRRSSEIPIVLFSYFNPIMAYGFERLARDASDIGIDGVLVTDAVDAESAALRNTLRAYGIELISLIAPTTNDSRLRDISDRSDGFLYAVSRAGVTGARERLSTEAEWLVARARKYTELPIAVGFGISTAEQIEEVWRYADAAVVGSAIVAKIGEAHERDVVFAVESFVRGLLPQFAKRTAEL